MQFFGQFLVEVGAVVEAQVYQALDLMEANNFKLGQLAVRKGLLTEQQADDVNLAQRHSDRPFGSIAVFRGLLTEEQVGELLFEQEQTRVRIGEALVRLGHLGGDDLEHWLVQFKRTDDGVQGDNVMLWTLPGYLNGNRIAEFVLRLLPRVIGRLTPVKIKVPRQWQRAARLAPFAVASVLVNHEQGLRIALAAERSFAVALERAYSRGGSAAVPGDELGNLYHDTIGEFLNIAGGMIIQGLEEEGWVVELDWPTLGVTPLGGYAFDLVTTHGKATLVLSEP